MMELDLHLKSSGDGPPQVMIPNQYMWDFVEYLAFQRVHVIYTNYDEYFAVSFPTMNYEGVQGMLDDWIACAARFNSVTLCGR
jgi:hypothetical protein